MAREWTPELIREQFGKRLGTLFNGHVGIEFVEGGHGFAKLRLPIRDEILQPTGVVHGGAVATLADVTAGIAAHLSYPPGTDIVPVDTSSDSSAPTGTGRRRRPHAPHNPLRQRIPITPIAVP